MIRGCIRSAELNSTGVNCQRTPMKRATGCPSDQVQNNELLPSEDVQATKALQMWRVTRGELITILPKKGILVAVAPVHRGRGR